MDWHVLFFNRTCQSMWPCFTATLRWPFGAGFVPTAVGHQQMPNSIWRTSHSSFLGVPSLEQCQPREQVQDVHWSDFGSCFFFKIGVPQKSFPNLYSPNFWILILKVFFPFRGLKYVSPISQLISGQQTKLCKPTSQLWEFPNDYVSPCFTMFHAQNSNDPQKETFSFTWQGPLFTVNLVRIHIFFFQHILWGASAVRDQWSSPFTHDCKQGIIQYDNGKHRMIHHKIITRMVGNNSDIDHIDLEFPSIDLEFPSVGWCTMRSSLFGYDLSDDLYYLIDILINI